MKIKNDKSLRFAIDTDETGDLVGLTLMTGKSIQMDKVEALTLAQSIISATLGWSSHELSCFSRTRFFSVESARGETSALIRRQLSRKPTKGYKRSFLLHLAIV